MADFSTSELYIDTTFNFASVSEAINDGVTVDNSIGGIDFSDAGSITGGTPLTTGGGFFMGYEDSIPTFMIGDFSGDYIYYGTSDATINSRMTGLELTGSLLGPSTFTIDPATHADDAGLVKILGDVQIGDSDYALIETDGSARFTSLDIAVDGDSSTTSVAYISDTGVIFGKQFSTNNGGITQGGQITGTSININSGQGGISSVGLVTGQGININSGTLTVDSAGDIATSGDLTVNGSITLDGSTDSTLTIGDSYFDHEGNLWIGNTSTGGPIYIGIDGTLDLNYAFSDLDEVYVNNPAHGQFIRYSNTGEWVNTTVTTDHITEGTSNLYYTGARVDTAFDARFNTKDTDDLAEGSTNLYFTTSNANTAIDNRVTKTFVENLAINSSSLTNDAGFITTSALSSYATTASITAANYASESYVDTAISNVETGDTPAIYASGGSPLLTTGITAAEVRTLIGAGDGDFDNLANKPTNLSEFNNDSGFITSVPAHYHSWSYITATPTTISGYGITDAFDGAYSSLTGAPTIPTDNTELTNGAGYITSYSVSQDDVTAHQAALSITESQISDLGSYLTSVDWTDISNKPDNITDAGIVVQLLDLQDVSGSGSSTGDVLTKYSDGSFGFEQRPIAYGVDIQTYTVTSADDLTFEVDYGASNKVVVSVNGTVIDNSHYSDTALDSITFNSGTSLEVGDIVQLIGYTTIADIDPVNALGDLTDVATSGATTGQALVKTVTGFAFDNYSWDNLDDTPTTISGYGITDAFDGAYSSLTGKPTIPADVSDLTDTTNLLTHFDGAYSSLTGAPTNVSDFYNDNNYLASSALTTATGAASLGGGSIAWNSTTKKLTYYPPDLSGYLTTADIPVSTVDFDPVGTDNSTDVTLNGIYDYLTITNQTITLNQIDYDTDIANTPTIPVSGTDFDPAGTDNSTDVTLSGSYDYLTISGQTITVNQVDYDTDIANTPPALSDTYIHDLKNVATPTASNTVLTVTDYTVPSFGWVAPGDLTGLAGSESGTWTVNFKDESGNTSNTTATGTYHKSGDIVTASFRVSNIDKSGMVSSDRFVIHGLPEVAAADGLGAYLGNQFITGYVYYSKPVVYNGDDFMYLQASLYSNDVGTITWAGLNNNDTSDIFLSITYITS